MGAIGFVICPHLKGSMEGIVCSITNNLIRNIEESAVRFCMGRHHEACSVYMQSLQSMIEHGSYSRFATIELRQ